MAQFAENATQIVQATSSTTGSAGSVPRIAGLGELDALTKLKSQMAEATKALLSSAGLSPEAAQPLVEAGPSVGDPLQGLGLDMQASAASTMQPSVGSTMAPNLPHLLGAGVDAAAAAPDFAVQAIGLEQMTEQPSNPLSEYYAQLAGHVAMGGELTAVGLGVTDNVAAQEQVQQELMAAYYKQFQDLEQFHHQTAEAVQLQMFVEAAEHQQVSSASHSSEADESVDKLVLKKGKQAHILCHNWLRGHCARGDSCSYNHPVEQKGAIGNRGPKQLMEHNYKTSICKYYAAGRCSKGEDCIFAHGADELRVPGQRLSDHQRRKIQEWDAYVAKKQQHDREMKQREQLSAQQDALQREEMAKYLAEVVQAGQQPLIGARADPASFAFMQASQGQQLAPAAASTPLPASLRPTLNKPYEGPRKLGSTSGSSLAAYINVKRATDFGNDALGGNDAKRRKSWNEWR